MTSSILGLFWLVTRSEDRQQKPIKLKGWKRHNDIVQRTAANIRRKKPGHFISVTKKSSVIGRATDYKKDSFKIKVSELNEIIEINRADKTAWIESNCKMEKITDILLSHGYILKMTPEFKNISMGGSFQGLGIETSSFKYGFTHHITQEIEIILPNGEVQRVKRDNDRLFQCIAGSYNSIALVVALKMELIAMNPNQLIAVEYKLYNTKERFMDEIIEVCQSENDTLNDFVEGLKLRDCSNKYVTCFGKIVSLQRSKYLVRNKKRKILDMSTWYHMCWFAHICHMFDKNNRKTKKLEYIYIKDYLFRHDRGVFWNTAMKTDEMSQKLFGPFCSQCLFGERASEHWLIRFLFGGFLTCTKSMILKRTKLKYRSEELTAYKRHTHDYGPSATNTVAFLDNKLMKGENGYFSKDLMWFCPGRVRNIRGVPNKSYVFLPDTNKSDDICVDIGIYGNIPKQLRNATQRTWYDTVTMFQYLDRYCAELGGTKGLYSSCFLSEKEFWTHYNHTQYKKWRNELKSYDSFMDVYEKVGKMGRLYSNVKKDDPFPFDAENIKKMSWSEVIDVALEITS